MYANRLKNERLEDNEWRGCGGTISRRTLEEQIWYMGSVWNWLKVVSNVESLGHIYQRPFPANQVLLTVRNYLLISLYSPSGGAIWLQWLYHWLTNCLQQSPAR